jgi:hypothetical protein
MKIFVPPVHKIIMVELVTIVTPISFLLGKAVEGTPLRVIFVRRVVLMITFINHEIEGIENEPKRKKKNEKNKLVPNAVVL